MKIPMTATAVSALVLSFILAGLSGSVAIAATPTAKIGDTTGKEFVAQCAPGEALAGIDYNHEHVMVAVAPLCRPYQDETAGPVQKVGTAKGIQGGVRGQAVLCPEDRPVVQAFSIYLNASVQVHSVRVTCAPSASQKKAILLKATTTTQGEATSHRSVDCPGQDGYAVGIVGTFGRGIQSLGLLCHEPKDDEVASADTGKGQGGNDGGITITGLPFELQINIGPGSGGLSFGPKGKARVMLDDSTVYSDRGNNEIGQVEQGDMVTVIGCEKDGKGWCQIIKPMPGLVWGRDIK